jgi:hypothetical protein
MENYLRNLKGKWVLIEYGHPLRASFEIVSGVIFEVAESVVTVLVERPEELRPVPQGGPVGPGEVMHAVALPPERQYEYIFKFLRLEGVISVSLPAGVVVTYNHADLPVKGSELTSAEPGVYRLRHANWEKWEAALRIKFQERLEKYGIIEVTKEVPKEVPKEVTVMGRRAEKVGVTIGLNNTEIIDNPPDSEKEEVGDPL